MDKQITNCGLIALSNLSDLKNISVRSLLSIAEDNGVPLYAYAVMVDDIPNLQFPAILHSDNHFSYVATKEEIPDLKYTGIVLLPVEASLLPLPVLLYHFFKGATWVAAAVGSATVTAGAIQYFKGKSDQKKNKRPDYQIPDEVNQNLSLEQRMALQGLPQEQKQQYIDNIQRNSSNSLRELGTRNAGLAGVATANQQQGDAYQNLLGMDSQARMANQKGVIDANQNLANYRDQAFQTNQLNPYYEKTAQNQAMMGAGLQNIGKGVQLGGSGFSSYGKSNGGYPAQGSPYNGYKNSNPSYFNYNQNSIQYSPNNGMYNNDSSNGGYG